VGTLASGIVSPRPMSHPDYDLSTLDHFVGSELGVSGWHLADARSITAFTESGGGPLCSPLDVRRAEEEGGTLACGLPILSLLPTLRAEVRVFPDNVRSVVSYGFDRVRFLAPIHDGDRIRLRVRLTKLETTGAGRVILATRNTVEVEDRQQPAVIADALHLLIP
jgi:acyl dehydratase